MKRRKLALVLVMAMLFSLCSNVVFAEEIVTYYVAASGSDENEGSMEAPFATLGKAFEYTTKSGISYKINISGTVDYNGGYTQADALDITVVGQNEATINLKEKSDGENNYFHIKNGKLAFENVDINANAMNKDKVFQLSGDYWGKIKGILSLKDVVLKGAEGKTAINYDGEYISTEIYISDSQMDGKICFEDYTQGSIYLSGKVIIPEISSNGAVPVYVYADGKLSKDSAISFGKMMMPGRVSGENDYLKDQFIEDSKNPDGGYTNYLSEEDVQYFSILEDAKSNYDEMSEFIFEKGNANRANAIWYSNPSSCELLAFKPYNAIKSEQIKENGEITGYKLGLVYTTQGMESMPTDYALSPGASAMLDGKAFTSGDNLDFSEEEEKTVTVTSYNGNTKDYVIENKTIGITSFDIGEDNQRGESQIVIEEDEYGYQNCYIKITPYKDVNLAAIKPNFTVIDDKPVEYFNSSLWAYQEIISGETELSSEKLEEIKVNVSDDKGYTLNKYYSIKLATAVDRETGHQITSFTLPGQADSKVDETKGTIDVYVPEGMDLTALKPSFVASDYAKVFVGGEEQVSGESEVDLSAALEEGVTYTVQAEDKKAEHTKDYTVKVYYAPTLTSFTIPGGTTEIEDTDIIVTLPFGAARNNLIAEFAANNASYKVTVGGVEQVSKETVNDFTNPVTYKVTPANGGFTTTYTVTVQNAAPGQYNVVYKDNEGSTLTSLSAAYDNAKTYTEGKGLTFPSEAPYIKAGYKFLGWYDSQADGQKVTAISNTQKGEVVVYAHWEQVTHNISYFDHKGVAITENLPADYDNAKIYNEAQGLTLPTVKPYTRSGYKFKGWYDSQTGGKKVTVIGTEATEDVVIYARWSSKSSGSTDTSTPPNNTDTTKEQEGKDTTTTPEVEESPLNSNEVQVGSNNQAEVSAEKIQELLDEGKNLVIVNKGVKLEISQKALEEYLANNNGEALQVTLAPVTATKLENIMSSVNEAGELSTVKGMDSWMSITSESGKALSFSEPMKLSLDLSEAEVEDASKLTLVKYETLPDGTSKVVKLGGSFDEDASVFTTYISGAGDYGMMAADNLTQINMQIDNDTLEVNGAAVDSDAAPMLVNDTTMVPLRTIAEALGAEVEWDEVNKEAVITLDGQTIRVGLDEGAMLYKDRTFVPLRYVSEKLGANVLWVPSTKEIQIVK